MTGREPWALAGDLAPLSLSSFLSGRCFSKVFSKGFLGALLGALLLGGAGLVLHAVWPILFPPLIAVAPWVPGCDLRHGVCTAHLPGGGKVQFSIEPRSIPVLRPLALTVRVEGLDPRSVQVDFSGTDMNMGYNRIALELVAEGSWKGQATLPVCVRSRMSWEARVLLHTDAGIMAAPFRFETFSSSSSE